MCVTDISVVWVLLLHITFTLLLANIIVILVKPVTVCVRVINSSLLLLLASSSSSSSSSSSTTTTTSTSSIVVEM